MFFVSIFHLLLNARRRYLHNIARRRYLHNNVSFVGASTGLVVRGPALRPRAVNDCNCVSPGKNVRSSDRYSDKAAFQDNSTL